MFKFNYYLYRKTNNIKNIGEVDTIINWYMNGCDYSFLINKNVAKNDLNIKKIELKNGEDDENITSEY